MQKLIYDSYLHRIMIGTGTWTLNKYISINLWDYLRSNQDGLLFFSWLTRPYSPGLKEFSQFAMTFVNMPIANDYLC